MKSERMIRQLCNEYDECSALNSLRGWKRLIHELDLFDKDCRKYRREETGLYEASAFRYKFVIAPEAVIYFECPDEDHTLGQRIEEAEKRFVHGTDQKAMDRESQQIWHDLRCRLMRIVRHYDRCQKRSMKSLLGHYEKIHDLKEAEIQEMLKKNQRERYHI